MQVSASDFDIPDRSDQSSRDSIFLSEFDQTFSSGLFEAASHHMELCQKISGTSNELKALTNTLCNQFETGLGTAEKNTLVLAMSSLADMKANLSSVIKDLNDQAEQMATQERHLKKRLKVAIAEQSSSSQLEKTKRVKARIMNVFGEIHCFLQCFLFDMWFIADEEDTQTKSIMTEVKNYYTLKGKPLDENYHAVFDKIASTWKSFKIWADKYGLKPVKSVYDHRTASPPWTLKNPDLLCTMARDMELQIIQLLDNAPFIGECERIVKQWETDAVTEKHWMFGFNKFMPLVKSASGQQQPGLEKVQSHEPIGQYFNSSRVFFIRFSDLIESIVDKCTEDEDLTHVHVLFSDLHEFLTSVAAKQQAKQQSYDSAQMLIKLQKANSYAPILIDDERKSVRDILDTKAISHTWVLGNNDAGFEECHAVDPGLNALLVMTQNGRLHHLANIAVHDTKFSSKFIAQRKYDRVLFRLNFPFIWVEEKIPICMMEEIKKKWPDANQQSTMRTLLQIISPAIKWIVRFVSESDKKDYIKRIEDYIEKSIEQDASFLTQSRESHLHVSKKAAVKRAIGVKFEFANGTYNGIWRFDSKVWSRPSGPFPFGRGRYDAKRDLIFEGCWDFDGTDGLGFGKVRNVTTNAIQFGCWKFTMDPELGLEVNPEVTALDTQELSASEWKTAIIDKLQSASRQVIVTMKRGETVLNEGEDAKKLYYVKQGSVRAYHNNHMIYESLTENIIGLSILFGRSTFTFYANEDNTELIEVPKAALYAFIVTLNRDMKKRVLYSLAKRFCGDAHDILQARDGNASHRLSQQFQPSSAKMSTPDQSSSALGGEKDKDGKRGKKAVKRTKSVSKLKNNQVSASAAKLGSASSLHETEEKGSAEDSLGLCHKSIKCKFDVKDKVLHDLHLCTNGFITISPATLFGKKIERKYEFENIPKLNWYLPDAKGATLGSVNFSLTLASHKEIKEAKEGKQDKHEAKKSELIAFYFTEEETDFIDCCKLLFMAHNTIRKVGIERSASTQSLRSDSANTILLSQKALGLRENNSKLLKVLQESRYHMELYCKPDGFVLQDFDENNVYFISKGSVKIVRSSDGVAIKTYATGEGDVMTLNESAFFRDLIDRDTDDFTHGRLRYVCVGEVEIQALPVHYISLLMVKYSDWFPQEWYRNLCEVLMRKIGKSEPQQSQPSGTQ